MVVEAEDLKDKKLKASNKLAQAPPKKKRKVTTKQDPKSPPSCPIHPSVPLQHKTSVSGWEYCVCPDKDCFVFTGLDQVKFYLEQLRTQLQDYYKTMDLSVWQCTCQAPVTLSLSRSEKNPDRLYFRCSRRTCDFFQWADELPKYQPSLDAYPKEDYRHVIL